MSNKRATVVIVLAIVTVGSIGYGICSIHPGLAWVALGCITLRALYQMAD